MSRLFASLCILWTSGLSASGATIGLDGRSAATKSFDLLTGTEFDDFRGLITGAGHTIQPVLAFDGASLAGLDALIMRQANESFEDFSATEIQAIHAFVAAGGGLLLFSEGGFSSNASVPNLNLLVQPWGVQFAASATFPAGLAVSGLAPHPVTDQVLSIGEDFLREITSIMPPAIDLTPGSTVKVAAVVDHAGGSGNVVFLTDTNMVTDADATADFKLSSLDNRIFITNAIELIVGATTQGCAGAGGVVPKLSLSPSTATVGTQVNLAITGALGGADAILVFGGDLSEIPMGGGCSLNVAPLFPVTLVLPLGGVGPGTGSLRLPAVVPPGTSGLSVALQAFIDDPAGAIGFANSNAVKLVVP